MFDSNINPIIYDYLFNKCKLCNKHDDYDSYIWEIFDDKINQEKIIIACWNCSKNHIFPNYNKCFIRKN